MPPAAPDPPEEVAAVTVGQLLAGPALADAVLAGGEGGLDGTVADVVMSSASARPDRFPDADGALLVIDAAQPTVDSYHIDLSLRAAHDSGMSAVLLVGAARPPALAAVRLADKLHLPLLVARDADALVVADAVRRDVLAPGLIAGQAIRRLLGDLRRAPPGTGMDGVLGTIADRLRGEAALLGPSGSVVAGDLTDAVAVDLLDARPALHRDGTVTDVVHPLQLAPRERPTFWLVCRLRSATAAWTAFTAEALDVASWYVSTRLVADRLERERDARFRLGVLNAILGSADRPDAALLEQLGVLGWRVDGWCTGIHIAASGDADALLVLSRTDELIRLLHDAGVRGALVERPDGWSAWLVDPAEPPTRAYADLVERLRGVVDRFLERSPSLHLHVGVGRPYQDLAGLRESLTEAHEAATIARAGGDVSAVRHIDEMGLRRILLGWYASDSFAELARTLLGPVLAVDRSGELLQTLETYLDCESSATEAAARLRLHRNTVINRLERIRSSLTVDLGDSDERLAVHLACRVLRLHSDRPPSA